MRPRRDIYVSAAIGALLAVTALVYLWLHDDRPALLGLLAVEIAAGREASIPAGLAAGLDWQTAALAATFIELVSLFALFPLLVGLAAGLHKVRWLESSLSRAQAYARRNPDVDVLALTALTIMPFLPVGALTSVLIGELLRIPSRYLLPALAGALIIANVGTAYVADRFIHLFPDPALVAAAMTALVLLAGIGMWLYHRLASRRAAAGTQR